ncbi:MAG: FKBP-type peptidyl-prolyl cis-trans isomerase [Bacteriovoracaceae bacterium]|nr:FKBP-type peptidyl-prolyl cis-trans isomerase [Bacteriovoracaceae bacterium]
MKRLFVLLAVLPFAISCGKGGKPNLKTEDDKVLYSMGNMLGGNIQRLQLTDDEVRVLAAGLQDSATNKKSAIDTKEFQAKISEFFRARMEKVSLVEKKKGDEFRAKFEKEAGVQKTASGLLYKIENPGSAVKPSATDTVEVNYHGTLIDGTVFDSSIERGKPISFPLDRVIKGWTEGLQLIGEGGKMKLVIPADLAYGDAGAPPKISGGATLSFDVELIKVTKTPVAPAPKKAGKK